MQFGAHYLPTYIPALDGPEPEFYRRMFEQTELLDRLGFHQVWVTEHHFHYVAGSEREAVEEAGPYLHNYWTLADAQNRVRSAARQSRAKEQIAGGNVIAGDPQRCIDLIRRWRDALGLTVVSGTFYFGGMPQEMALQNIRRFAAEVMPTFVEGHAIASSAASLGATGEGA